MTCAEVRDLAPAYLLGALEAAEERAVSEHLESCPEAHAELVALGAGVAALAESVPLVEPPSGLKGRILAAAAQDLPARQAAVAPAAAPSSAGLPAFLDTLLGRTPGQWAMRAVAAVLIVALAGWNFVLQGELAGTKSYQQRLDEALALARQPGAQLALLAPAGGGPGPTGVAVMPPSSEGRLVMTGLAPTTGSQVYEAWAILEGLAPIPIGGFTVGSDGVGYFDRMPPAPRDQAVIVAITLEPGPNPTAPSSDPISVGVSTPVAGGSSA